MDVAGLVLAVILGGGSGGIVTIAWNWYMFGKTSRRQRELDVRQRGLDFLESFRRQADSAEKRGDIAERDRTLTEYEQQERAHRTQLALEKSVPAGRISQNE